MRIRDSSRRLSEAINKILTDANKRGQHIAGDDEIRIDIAVSNFVLNVQSGALAIPSRSTVPA